MTNTTLNTETKQQLHGYFLRLADSSLTMGQRLAEWCGHGPFLEEDVALTNVALDTNGLAADLAINNQSPDDLAFLRDAHDYRNPLITELPRGDFAFTTLKQYFIDVFNLNLYAALTESGYQPLALATKKAGMEVKYHADRSEAWIRRLALSTPEAKKRLQKALDDLWFYTPELFEMDEGMKGLMSAQLVPDYAGLEDNWRQIVEAKLSECKLSLPQSGWIATGGLQGEHSEHLGYLLAEMQFLPRAYPGCEW